MVEGALNGFMVEVLADEEVLDASSVGKGRELVEVQVAEVEGWGHGGKKGGGRLTSEIYQCFVYRREVHIEPL